LGISIGDPLGIGPEIIVRALVELAAPIRSGAFAVRVFGSAAVLGDAAGLLGLSDAWRNVLGAGVRLVEVGVDAPPERPARPTSTRFGGMLSFAAVEAAIAAARRPPGDPEHVDVIVTAPISKTSWKLAGHTRFPGHTELLAERFDATESGMLFVGPSMRVMLATIHVPLREVPRVLTRGVVLRAIRLADRACRDFGVSRPAIGVCGVNPHAGEGGLLGHEDDAVIAPAVAAAREAGLNATGPHPADTIFTRAVLPPRGPGTLDAIVAMYHDQGLIPIKLLDKREAVNVTVGLSTIRTSPAHGTAFDIAGAGTADPASMLAAIRTALELLDRARGADRR